MCPPAGSDIGQTLMGVKGDDLFESGQSGEVVTLAKAFEEVHDPF